MQITEDNGVVQGIENVLQYSMPSPNITLFLLLHLFEHQISPRES